MRINWKFIVVFIGIPALFIFLLLKIPSDEVKVEDINSTQEENVTVEEDVPERNGSAWIKGGEGVEIVPDERLELLASTFCEERSKPNVRYVNFDDFAEMIEKAPEEVYLNPGGGPPSLESCKKIAVICLKRWNEDDCLNIAKRKIKIGMDKEQLMLSWGLPNDKNNTHTLQGIHTQWVYGNFGPYVYLEGKDELHLKVTSWQD